MFSVLRSRSMLMSVFFICYYTYQSFGRRFSCVDIFSHPPKTKNINLFRYIVLPAF